MMKAMNERDLRAIKIGAVGAVAIVAYLLAGPWLNRWQIVRAEKELALQKLNRVAVDSAGALPAEQLKLISAVPKLEMPADEKTQGDRFRETFNQQLQKAGIKPKSMQYLAAKKQALGGYRTLRLQCRARCETNQVLTLLESLNENPYFVGVEGLEMKPDARNRNEVDLTLTVSTFSK